MEVAIGKLSVNSGSRDKILRRLIYDKKLAFLGKIKMLHQFPKAVWS